MALTTIVGSPTADAYISLADFKNYCDSMGYDLPLGDDKIEQGIRRGTQWLDSAYRNRFIGKVADIDQALEWPRSGVVYRGEELPNDVIPKQLIHASAEAARREIVKPGSMSPDLKRGGAIKSVGAGSAKVEFADGAPVETTFTTINALLSGFVSGDASGRLYGFVARA